ncbi:hypothetical protein COX86_02010 [Candidatus Micrarchaeota archaeon CG_4_10_14_0_2_um_filter_60_11]|nr:MAG: hypothetical protein AUJ16_04515 [Candidatus Micrarchaeota archaeon CG1_02_60_51]PIO02138.1 MAG: hypothetical protein COT58_01575 [Candidatus Micrarchaeota archaeon CG09_land_8_20_14_0_10_60_16]PIY91439.1 MAG: hypothetical protein COY71_03135 [Candidatus Micrarchaeota archaeon CG_4_10_14_0_8_um_filter_60_7]PIZ91002.1 MAG: hypothetical protein COX86_02010 [Candidatus Micrarchaeota archaeon CG_4_10_14_0_2_um_filter_60_11]
MVVISLGGSLLYDDKGAVNRGYLKRIAPLLKGSAIVVGGGSLARRYAERARAKTHSEFWADRAAIKATRENARLVARACGGKYCKAFDAALAVWRRGGTPVMGGMIEGLTTDADAVLLAECLGEKRLVNASKVAGIYDRDPSKKGAKMFKKMTHAQLAAFAARFDERKARTNFPFDLVACKLAARSKIRVDFVDGRNPSRLRSVLAGRAAGGTVVEY